MRPLRDVVCALPARWVTPGELHSGDFSLGPGLLDACAFIRSTQQTLPEHLQGDSGPCARYWSWR